MAAFVPIVRSLQQNGYRRWSRHLKQQLTTVFVRGYAGHNKWSKIRHKKAAVEVQRSKEFTKLGRELMAAVRDGGANPESNLKLSNVLSRAKTIGMPKATIERVFDSAKKRLSQVGEVVVLEAKTGQGGGDLIIEVITDNKRRTRPEIRAILTKHGAKMGDSGSSMFNFVHKGVISVEKKNLSSNEDILDIAISCGAEDVLEEADDEEDLVYFYCNVNDLSQVTSKLQDHFKTDLTSTAEYLPQNDIQLSEDLYDKVTNLIAKLEDHNDVLRVYTNIVQCPS